MSHITDSPPKAPPIQYAAPLGTRWAKEKAAAGGTTAFDLPSDPKTIGPWILGECIGKGASGRVKIAKHRQTGQLAAVKILPIAPLVNSRTSLATQQAKSEKQRLGVDREITMMKLMKHPNIMRIYDVFEGETELFLVLEYVQGGELFDFLVNRGRLPPQEALEYFKQIIYGLNYAHTFSIIHRDLKPENILIASLKPPLIKIADWGMAAFAPPSLQLETSCGSPHYASPEIVNGEKYQGNATDIWSCGVILFALLTGRLPFDDKNVRNLLAKVKTGKYDMPNWIDPLAKDLLTRILVVDVKKRVTIPEILSHPWLTTNYSSLDSGIAVSFALPPLPPTPSQLAEPIASVDDIDPDLFASLKIIWGKNSDSEEIIRDLCSPPGQGVHAKAFYYLLRRYREETVRKRLADGAADYQDIITTKSLQETLGQKILRPYRPRAQTSPAQHRPLAVLTNSVPTPSSIASQGPQETKVAHLSASPAGPGLPPMHSTQPQANQWHTHFKRECTADSAHTSIPQYSRPFSTPGTVRGGPRSQPPSRGNTYVAPTSSKGTNDPPNIGFVRHLQNLNNTKNSSHHLSVKSRTRVSAENDELPKLMAPKTTDPVLQKTMDKITECVNEIAVQVNSQSAPSTQRETFSPTFLPLTQPKEPLVRKDRVYKGKSYRSADKENQSTSDEGWSYIDQDQTSFGLGVDLGRDTARAPDIGKDIGNMPRNTHVLSPSKTRKDKKFKPPPLDIRPRNTGINTLGSPILTSPPMQTISGLGGSSRLSSPVVGEFKGWFTNLFNWKHNNQGILYSPYDISKTSLEIGRMIGSLGISIDGTGIMPQDTSQGDTLKCRIDHIVTDSTGNTWKPVRFRVEFSTSPMDTPLSPKDSYFPASNYLALPNIPLTHTPRSRVGSFIGKGTLTNTPLPPSSPTPLNLPQLPPGYACIINMIHEKGSVSTFRMVCRRLRELSCEAMTSHSCFIPAMPTTQYPDNQQPRTALN